MNKMYLLILLSSSILIAMEKKRISEPDSTKPKNVSFSSEALDKLALTQELIDVQAQGVVVSPPAIPRTKLSPGEKYPIRPELSSNKIGLPHCDSAPDIDGATIEKVRNFQHLRDLRNKEDAHIQ